MSAPERSVREVVAELVSTYGTSDHVDQQRAIMRQALALIGGDHDRLDLKITSAALSEMRAAYEMFAPYRGVPKVTIFGSARTRPEDPLYRATRDLARSFTDHGWMVVTGAGPGIMAAGMEGAGRDHALGVNIRLPFEQVPSEHIDADKLVEMRYFFTRKLMLMKESSGFVALPGGFGTLDETFELLTLEQTGKAAPTPTVLVDAPGSGYWRAWERFLRDHVLAGGYISGSDLSLVHAITDDTDEAVERVLGFYANHHSSRYVDDVLVLRLRRPPDEAELAKIDHDFSDMCTGPMSVSPGPLPGEGAELGDLARLVVPFDRTHHGRLHQLIDRVNALGT